ncbi:MAG TPA: hypothetical protein VLD38_01275 [Nitrosopumilaceae archaeon]|nr:hypothetical protein [Nitrosopumilaceae archaeon]
MKFTSLFFFLAVILLPFVNAEAAVLQKGMGEDQCLETDTIHVGDSVVWMNYFDRAYQATSVDNYDHVDGIFDSGITPAGGVFVHSFDETGDYLYFCSVPHQGHGLIRVVDKNSLAITDPVLSPVSEGTVLTAKSTEGSLIANLVSATPQKGETIPIRIFFTGKYGEPLSDVNYAIIALQDGSLVPVEYDDRQPDGKVDYNVGPLISDNTLVIQLRILGLGHPHELNYIKISSGDVITLQTEGGMKKPLSISLIKESKIPDWFGTVLNWYDQKLITEEEVLNGFKFLIDKNIIKT